MKAYMGYDGSIGSSEGAVLIFTNSAKEAKILAHPHMRDFFDTEWIDLRVKWLKNLPEELRRFDTGSERVIDSPPVCPNCQLWGYTLVEDKKYCEYCFENEWW